MDRRWAAVGSWEGRGGGIYRGYILGMYIGRMEKKMETTMGGERCAAIDLIGLLARFGTGVPDKLARNEWNL